MNVQSSIRITLNDCMNVQGSIRITLNDCMNVQSSIRITLIDCMNVQSSIQITLNDCRNVQSSIRITLNDCTNVQSSIRMVYPCRSSLISLAARNRRRNPTLKKFFWKRYKKKIRKMYLINWTLPRKFNLPPKFFNFFVYFFCKTIPAGPLWVELFSVLVKLFEI